MSVQRHRHEGSGSYKFWGGARFGDAALSVRGTDPVVLEWVEAARKGDQDAFAELVHAYQDAVYNLCYRILSEPGEAEDAAQEAFLRAYLHLDRYDPERPFKTWLLTIASNYCIDRLRRRRMQQFSIDDDDLPPNFELMSDEPEPEAVTLDRERSRMIQALLDVLPDDYRAAVTLRYWYDYSYTEIADILNTTESAIKSRLFRARGMLAERLEADLNMMRETDPESGGSFNSLLERL